MGVDVTKVAAQQRHEVQAVTEAQEHRIRQLR
jgi:hypothetical protein